MYLPHSIEIAVEVKHLSLTANPKSGIVEGTIGLTEAERLIRYELMRKMSVTQTNP